MQCANTRFFDALRAILISNGCILVDVTLAEYIAINPILEDAHIDDLRELEGMEGSHFVLSLALCMNLIGKKLNNANFVA